MTIRVAVPLIAERYGLALSRMKHHTTELSSPFSFVVRDRIVTVLLARIVLVQGKHCGAEEQGSAEDSAVLR